MGVEDDVEVDDGDNGDANDADDDDDDDDDVDNSVGDKLVIPATLSRVASLPPPPPPP